MKTQNPASNNLTNMQKKAIDQLHEMYKKSKNNQNSSFDNQAKHFKIAAQNIIKTTQPKSKKINILPNVFETILKNPDVTLIVVLVILLMDNEENFMLILALLYSVI